MRIDSEYSLCARVIQTIPGISRKRSIVTATGLP
jgi:hypothetical protein